MKAKQQLLIYRFVTSIEHELVCRECTQRGECCGRTGVYLKRGTRHIPLQNRTQSKATANRSKSMPVPVPKFRKARQELEMLRRRDVAERCTRHGDSIDLLHTTMR